MGSSVVIGDVFTGNVEKINSDDNKIKFVGKDEVVYSTTAFKNKAGVLISEAAFEKLVQDALLANDGAVKVTATKGTDGKYALEIVESPNHQAPAQVTNLTFVDTDADVNEVAGVITFTASQTAGATTNVYYNGAIVTPVAGAYTLPANTVLGAGELKVVVTSNVGIKSESTITVVDVVTTPAQDAFVADLDTAIVNLTGVQSFLNSFNTETLEVTIDGDTASQLSNVENSGFFTEMQSVGLETIKFNNTSVTIDYSDTAATKAALIAAAGIVCGYWYSNSNTCR